MLDSDTKRRIDNCRDILVGKVPDPKSQVEQITIALIYKFMDDMDAEAEELGGDRSFFTGEFARYGWTKLMASSLGGHEMLNLYAEAIQRMNENPAIPPLFRDIFKNAFLPYRDPETLRSFLKEINSFTYDHSERLGDAFEYLLSVLGSQGDAGQFRTPRHIIDFMVEIIDPKKDEIILDPACGTAGFLISAYKHILKHNSKGYREQQDREAYEEKGIPIEELPIDNPVRYSGNLLTPDERKQLSAKIGGYDISPDMVRLSLVNMYLHGFSDPHIEEYDTLTSDEKWSELANVILANPPFMSPKGGIRPHNRFAVQSKRSEVLFVDYISEHLTPDGRAAVVVPEGIIFQSQTAYKQLREILVKHYLVAVISLPAGVFNPYSGVKTSILVMNKQLAKQRDEVLFIKIENDGFNLGAQRRPIDKNDLPEAVQTVKAFFQHGDVVERKNVLAVSRERIGENGEWNLSGERYSEGDIRISNFEIVSLGAVCEVIAGQSPAGEYYNEKGEGLPFYQGKTEFSDRYIGKPKKWTTQVTKTAYENDILMSVRAPVGPVNLCVQESCIGRGLAAIRPIDSKQVSFLYVFHLLRATEEQIKGNAGAAFASINKKDIEAIQVPLPPLEVQKEIVAEIEGYQKIIDGARQVVENYQPRIPIHPDWPMVELGEVCRVGGIITKDVDAELPYIGADSLESNSGRLIQTKTAGEQGVSGPVYEFSGQRLLYSKIRPYLNKLTVVDMVGYCSSDMYPLDVNQQNALVEYLANYMLSARFNESIQGFYERANIPKINRSQLFSTKVPLPDIDTQRAITDEIEEEQSLVDASKKLIQRFEEKIKQTISRVWGEAE